MKRFLVIYVLLSLGCVAVAQPQAEDFFVDSLQQEFNQSKDYQQKARLLFKISDYWSYRDTAVALQKLALSQKYMGNNRYLQALENFYRAGIYFGNDNAKSELLYLKSDSVLLNYPIQEAYEYRAKLWHNYAAIQQMKNDNVTFLKLTIEKCIPLAKQANNPSLLASYYADIGIVFNNLQQYQKAIDYLEQGALILNKAQRFGESYAWVQLNLSASFLNLKHIEKAKQALDRAEKSLESLPQSQYWALLFSRKSEYFNTINNYDSALENIEKGINFAQRLHLVYDKVNLQYQKIQLQKNTGKLHQAQQTLEQILQNPEYTTHQNNHLIFLREMISVEEQLQNYQSALGYQKQFQQIKDSMLLANERTQLMDLELKYNTSEKEKDLLILKAKNEKNQIIYFSFFLILLLVGLFSFHIMSQRRKKIKQKLLALELQKKDEVEKALKDGEEQERMRIAKELHDGLGGRITGVKMKLENYLHSHDDKQIATLVKHLDQALHELRQTARNLMPETLAKFGLEEALSDYCLSLQQNHLNISFYSNNLEQITDKKHQINIYRIIQELIGNALRHAKASQILVQCTYQCGLLLIEVEDNGIGFDPKKNRRNLGLINIEKRVQLLNGSLKIESEKNKGTNITIEANLNL